jgi:hypothetical protein
MNDKNNINGDNNNSLAGDGNSIEIQSGIVAELQRQIADSKERIDCLLRFITINLRNIMLCMAMK